MTTEVLNPKTKQNVSLDWLLQYPLGQRLLKAGFAVVTHEQLYTRFCCEQIQERANAQRVDELMTRAEEHIAHHGGKVDRDPHWLRPFSSNEPSLWINHGWFSANFSMDGRRWIRCRIRTLPLDSYVHDVIPDRVVETLTFVKKLGVEPSQLKVCYPVMEEYKHPDPVVVADLSTEEERAWIELGMWE